MPTRRLPNTPRYMLNPPRAAAAGQATGRQLAGHPSPGLPRGARGARGAWHNADALSCDLLSLGGLEFLGAGGGTALLGVALEEAAGADVDAESAQVFEEFAAQR